MKRSCPSDSPQSWTVFGNDHPVPRNFYRHDDSATWIKDPSVPQKPPQREFLDGLIDDSIVNLPTKSIYPPAKVPRLLPLEITPLVPPKRSTSSDYTTESDPHFHSSSYPTHSPLPPTAPFRSLDTLPALPTAPLHLDYDTSEKDSFEKARAEIEEILSPVSDNGSRRPKHERLLFPTAHHPLPPSVDTGSTTDHRDHPAVPSMPPVYTMPPVSTMPPTTSVPTVTTVLSAPSSVPSARSVLSTLSAPSVHHTAATLPLPVSTPAPPPPPPSVHPPQLHPSLPLAGSANNTGAPVRHFVGDMRGGSTSMRDALHAMGMTRGPGGTTTKRRSSSASTKCHVCGKTYTETSNLSKHVRTVHLKLRPFRCHLCASSFAEKNKLGKHIQSVHEHARPYKCELCSATFSQASDRKRHRLVLHEGCRPFICRECGKAFGRRSSLTQHCQRVHNKGLPRTTGNEQGMSTNLSATTSMPGATMSTGMTTTAAAAAAAACTTLNGMERFDGVAEDPQRSAIGSGMSVATLVTPLVPPLIPPLVPSLAPPLLMPLSSSAEMRK